MNVVAQQAWYRLYSFMTLRGALSLLVVLAAMIPLVYVISNALHLDLAGWRGLWSSRLPGLLWNTLSLAVLVAAGCFVLGVSAAWWVARREFPGRRLAVWLMVMPLTIPTYVFAYIYTVLLDDDGWLGQLWIALFGTSPPELFNIAGVTFVLTLAGLSAIRP